MGIFLVETPGEEFLRIFHCQLCDFAEGLVNCRTSPGKHQHFIPIKQLTVALKSSPVLGFKKSLLLRSLVTFTKISNLANLCAKNSVAGADYRVRLCLTATQLVTHLKFQIQRYLYIYRFWTILTKSIYTTQKKHVFICDVKLPEANCHVFPTSNSARRRVGMAWQQRAHGVELYAHPWGKWCVANSELCLGLVMIKVR